MSTKSRRGMAWRLLTAAGLLLAAVSSAAGQETWRLEGQTLVPVASPEPGTPEALIAHARGLYVEGRFRESRKILEAWLKDHPFDEQSDVALLVLGDCQYKMGDHWKSYQTYEMVANNFSNGRAYRLALGRQFKVAMMFLEGLKRKWLGLRIVDMKDEAVRLLDRIRDREEGSVLGEKCLLATANYFYAKAEFFDAEYRYALYLQLYPHGAATRETLWRLAWCYQGMYRGTKYDTSAMAKARDAFQRFKQEYSQTAEAGQVDDILARGRWAEAKKQFEIGAYYARIGRKEAAAYYFRHVVAEYGDLEWAGASEAELRRLGYAAEQPAGETAEGQ